MTKITVLMSAHNGEEYLKEAIESVLSQTFKDFEFIIIDDASIDGTARILSQYTDPRIKVIKNEKNIGLTKSLNIGLKEARGEYVARMDADDASLPERLKIEKEFMDLHPDIVCVGSGTIIIDEKGKEIGVKHPPTDSELLKFHMILKNQMAHASVMFRKSIILKYGGYNEKIQYAQDYELWSRLIAKGLGFSNIQEPLIKYRLRDSSITQGMTKGRAYESARSIVYGNISHYIDCNGKDFLIFIESLHQHNVDSLYHAIIAQRVLSKLGKAYLKKERISDENMIIINRYIRNERIGAFKYYAMRNYVIFYKIIVNIKKLSMKLIK